MVASYRSPVRTRRWTGVAVVILLVAPRCAEAQESRPNERDQRPEVVEVQIEGTRAVDEADLRARLETRETSWVPLACDGLF